jgi:uncharacterized membrane protein YgdD (TMEM256/DUF423 family)
MASTPKAWAQAQFGSSDLGDARRTRRAVAVGAAITAKPGASLPEQVPGWADLKAAYRLLDQPAVTHAALTAPHRAATCAAATAEAGPVLFIQDTTQLDFSHHPAVDGLGPVGTGRGHGFLVHTTLALRPDPAQRPVLGLADQRVWTRTGTGLRHQPRAQRLARAKESDVWADSLETIGPAPAGAVWVSIGDRESDLFTHFDRARAAGWHSLVRARHDRLLAEAEGGAGDTHLLAAIRTRPAQAARTVVLSARAGGTPVRPQRLNLAWMAVRVRPPARCQPAEPLAAWCVRAWNDKVEWVLLSTVPVVAPADACTQVDWYACRWTLEEYHKGLKTGCGLEAVRLRTAGRLQALLGFAALAAVRLLQIRTAARSDPGARARASVDPVLVAAIAAHIGSDPDSLSAGQFWRAVAKLGGFIGRRSDGDPGWQTLWKGFMRLLDMCATPPQKCG